MDRLTVIQRWESVALPQIVGGGKRVYQAKRVSRSKQAGEVGEGKNGRGVGGDPVLPVYGQEEGQVSEEMENQIEG